MDITVALISTQIKWKEETDILMKPTKNNDLKKESLFRLSKLATIDKVLTLGRIKNGCKWFKTCEYKFNQTF